MVLGSRSRMMSDTGLGYWMKEKPKSPRKKFHM